MIWILIIGKKFRKSPTSNEKHSKRMLKCSLQGRIQGEGGLWLSPPPGTSEILLFQGIFQAPTGAEPPPP